MNESPRRSQAAFFFGGGTLAPERRASDNPIAIACFGFVTFFPLRPLFNLPRLNSCISFSTFFCALGPYFRPRLEDFFADELLERRDLLEELPEDLERDVPRWERLELRFEEDDDEPRLLDLLLRFLLRDPEELDLPRDELFLRAVAIGLASSASETQKPLGQVVPAFLPADRPRPEQARENGGLQRAHATISLSSRVVDPIRRPE